MIAELENHELKKLITDAAARLTSSRGTDGDRMLLDIPVTYPSGSSVVVEVEQKNNRVWVSDMGAGLLEAEMMAAQDSYQSLARTKAEEFGVQFDNSAMFALWVPLGRLEAAIVCVANASAQAAADAIRHVSEQQSRRQSALVFDRVSEIFFGSRRVVRSTEVRGKRTAWKAHNVVLFSDAHRAIFEPMTMNANSISSKFIMLSDLREAGEALSLNVVVEDIKSMDPKAQIVGDVANLIDLKVADEVFRQFGAVA